LWVSRGDVCIPVFVLYERDIVFEVVIDAVISGERITQVDREPVSVARIVIFVEPGASVKRDQVKRKELPEIRTKLEEYRFCFVQVSLLRVWRRRTVVASVYAKTGISASVVARFADPNPFPAFKIGDRRARSVQADKPYALIVLPPEVRENGSSPGFGVFGSAAKFQNTVPAMTLDDSPTLAASMHHPSNLASISFISVPLDSHRKSKANFAPT